jgi:hypothetical protein
MKQQQGKGDIEDDLELSHLNQWQKVLGIDVQQLHD